LARIVAYWAFAFIKTLCPFTRSDTELHCINATASDGYVKTYNTATDGGDSNSFFWELLRIFR